MAQTLALISRATTEGRLAGALASTRAHPPFSRSDRHNPRSQGGASRDNNNKRCSARGVSCFLPRFTNDVRRNCVNVLTVPDLPLQPRVSSSLANYLPMKFKDRTRPAARKQTGSTQHRHKPLRKDRRDGKRGGHLLWPTTTSREGEGGATKWCVLTGLLVPS